jgi:GxxExxY protein
LLLAEHAVNARSLSELTETIIACGITVHSATGPGLLESIYTPCLVMELQAQGLRVETERSVAVKYRDVPIGHHRIDIIVEGLVVIEVKSVKCLEPVHQAQLITYLKLTGCPIGLLMNFNVPLLTSGIRRVSHPDLYHAIRSERVSGGGANPGSTTSSENSG